MNFLRDNPRAISLVIVSSILFLIPNIFWFNGLNYVGGDDTLLYYIYPSEIIKNYLFNLATDNVLSGIGGYSFQFYQFPFFTLLSFLKSILPGINLQTFMYGLNMSLGFIFFYLLVGLWITEKSTIAVFEKIIGSLLYVFSIFSIYTLWQSLFTPYLVSIFPMCLFLFIRGVRTNGYFYILICSLVLSVMSITILLVPWVLLGLIVLLPILISEFVKYKKLFIKQALLLITLVFLLNFYWIYHFISPIIDNNPEYKNELLDITSSSFISDARGNITEVTRLNNITYPLLNLFHKNIQESGNWPNYPIFHNWYERFLILHLLLTIIILLAGIKLNVAKKNIRKFYLLSGLGWIIVLYLFTVRIGEFVSFETFVFLNDHIPGFSMFRNIQGKIAPAFPTVYALLFTVSIYIFLKFVRSMRIKSLILFGLLLLTFILGYPFIRGDFFNNPLWTTKNIYTTISEFNSDFKNLSIFLSTLSTNSRFFWFPVTSVNYVIIRDALYPNHFYTGLSPLQFLSGKSDMVGIMSLPQEMQKRFVNSYMQRDYEDIGFMFRELNVNYIIVNKDIPEELQRSYLFASAIPDLHNSQSELARVILGKKIRSFNKYDVYEIREEYKSMKIMLYPESTENESTKISIERTKNFEYNITASNLKGKQSLIFLERFSPYWRLYDSKNNPIEMRHESVFGYANMWHFDKKLLHRLPVSTYSKNRDGSVNFNFKILFSKQHTVFPAIIVSILSYFVVIFLLILTFVTKVKIKL